LITPLSTFRRCTSRLKEQVGAVTCELASRAGMRLLAKLRTPTSHSEITAADVARWAEPLGVMTEVVQDCTGGTGLEDRNGWDAPYQDRLWCQKYAYP
jgi:hypothetical protein